jgi:hypothetical protein
MRKLGAGILAAVAVLVSAAAAPAQETTREKSKAVYGLSIPDRVGSLDYRQTIDFESKAPGLGYGLRFTGPPGWMADVYLYDLGLKTIPADAGSDVIKQQLGQARNEVFALGQRGAYAKVSGKGDFAIPETGKARFICTSFGYFRGDRVDIEVDSFLCLSSWNNKFVKIRMTGPKGTISRSDATDFATAWSALLR